MCLKLRAKLSLEVTSSQFQTTDDFGSACLLLQTLFHDIISQNLKTMQMSLVES